MDLLLGCTYSEPDAAALIATTTAAAAASAARETEEVEGFVCASTADLLLGVRALPLMRSQGHPDFRLKQRVAAQRIAATGQPLLWRQQQRQQLLLLWGPGLGIGYVSASPDHSAQEG